jgi:hypothetical protein
MSYLPLSQHQSVSLEDRTGLFSDEGQSLNPEVRGLSGVVWLIQGCASACNYPSQSGVPPGLCWEYKPRLVILTCSSPRPAHPLSNLSATT